jgi:hypothetical protein
VVLFNDAVLWIRHLAFLQAPVESVEWGVWARQLSLQSSLLVVLLPPTLGGLGVGLFRLVSGAECQPPQCGVRLRRFAFAPVGTGGGGGGGEITGPDIIWGSLNIRTRPNPSRNLV